MSRFEDAESYFYQEWIRCPECGCDDIEPALIPEPVDGRNRYVECPDCGHIGVIVG